MFVLPLSGSFDTSRKLNAIFSNSLENLFVQKSIKKISPELRPNNLYFKKIDNTLKTFLAVLNMKERNNNNYIAKILVVSWWNYQQRESVSIIYYTKVLLVNSFLGKLMNLSNNYESFCFT